jgi:predicted flap endonuclease-1-like 5' DNA nuclease
MQDRSLYDLGAASGLTVGAFIMVNAVLTNNLGGLWFWGGSVILLGVVIGLIPQLQRRRQAEQSAPAAPAATPAAVISVPAAPTVVISAPATPAPAPSKAATAEKDDLQKLEGIGPKMEATLNAAGIHTFAQLTQASEAQLLEILTDAGLRLAPTLPTWPQQAALAAAGQWAELEALQDTLSNRK